MATGTTMTKTITHHEACIVKIVDKLD